MTLLTWVFLGGVMLVIGILADDWYAKRKHRPLSHMKPDLETSNKTLGMEEIDMTRMNRTIAENDRLNARNGANGHAVQRLNSISTRLRAKPNVKDGPKT